MARSELVDETKNDTQQDAANGPVDVLIGIAGIVNLADLQQRMQDALRSWPVELSRVAIAYPATSDAAAASEAGELGFGQGPRFISYSLPVPDPSSPPWVVTSAAQRILCSLALEKGARACAMLHYDLAMLNPDRLQLFLQPVLERQCDLVVPVYPSGRYEGLLNHSILSPLTRSLYGKRVEYPLPSDIGCSARMCERISDAAPATERNSGSLLWPATLAALGDYQICQVHVGETHATQTEGLDLSTVLGSLLGSAYAEMETYAAYWQRVRSSQSPMGWTTPATPMKDGEPVDVKPLIDSFLLGTHNLQEIWGLVLPPVTLLELKKLSRLTPDAFRMPDELWVRIIYDFALAHRLRKINRGHLLGALTPLYLGWVASYVREVSGVPGAVAEQRLERLARAYEDGKPYLLSRWRWPDRFNP